MNGAVIYFSLLFIVIFAHGILINVYGQTCGLSLFNPTSWLYYIVTSGSPWCRMLNHCIYMTDTIVQHIGLQCIPAFLFTFIGQYLPDFRVPNRPPP